MIIKVNQAYYFKFILLFYSRLTEKSKYLNSYFFSLKFLLTFTACSNSFYYLSKHFYTIYQNYLPYYKLLLRGDKYLKLKKNTHYSSNFLYLLFNRTLNNKFIMSKLI